MLSLVRVLLGLAVHFQSTVGLFTGTSLTGVDIDIGTVKEVEWDLVSEDDPEVSG